MYIVSNIYTPIDRHIIRKIFIFFLYNLIKYIRNFKIISEEIKKVLYLY